MGLPFLGSKVRKIDQIVAIDLGSHSTKAVHLQRRGDQIAILRYAIQDVESKDGALTAEAVGPRISQIVQALGTRCRQCVLALGAGDSLVRVTELPMVSVSDMRTMLKFNAKNYLQQDLSDYVFDCYVLPPRPGTKAEAPKPGQKVRVLVGGAKSNLVAEMSAAVKAAGLTAEAAVPGLIGPVNAFELAQPEAFRKEPVVLVDLGFRHSTISILLEGDPILSRVVAIGGDRVTTEIAQSLGIGYGEAESIKMGLAHEVQSAVESVLTPLGRELRASIDYFEHQQDRTIGQVYVSGAAAASDYMIEILKSELMVQCVPWNPVAPLTLLLPPEQLGEVEGAAARLAVAVGAGLAVM